jgi:polar amino acid transport system substrate-binding protein
MKKSLFTALILITVLVILLTSLSCKKKEEPVLRVGTNAEYPPFEFKNGEEFAGVDMDIVKAIATKMGMKYVITDMDFDALIPSLSANKIDIAVSAITITDERKNQVDFSIPYYVANQVIIGKMDSELKIEKLEDLIKYKVGAQNGTTGQIYIDSMLVQTKLMKKDNLKKYSTNIEAITDMQNGNIDFVIIDDSAAQGYAKLQPIKTVFQISTNEQYGIALQKNSLYKEPVNRALDDLIKTGEILDIVTKYIK